MIGAILGGSASSRLGYAARNAEAASLMGRRTVVVSGVPEIFPVGGRMPVLLAPGYEGTRDLDIAAECLAAESGLLRAAGFFAASLLSCEGADVNRSSNDKYWSDSLRSGLENLLLAACHLAAAEERTRSVSRVLCECVEDLRSGASERGPNGSREAPGWTADLPENARAVLNSLYLGKSSQTSNNHHTTLAPIVSALRAGAPEQWVEPLLPRTRGETLFIHAPSWEDPLFHTLLHLCLREGDFFLLAETHRWTERDRRRAAWFLSCEASRTDVVWTSASVPRLFSSFGSHWEAYARSGDSSVLKSFSEALANSAADGSARLKELRYETPASLDDDHLLLRTSAGWTVVPCAFLDPGSVLPLKLVERADGRGDAFDANLAEAEEFVRDARSLKTEEERRLYGVRLVEGEARPAGRRGVLEAWALERETALLPFPLSKKPHVALFGGAKGEPRRPLALFERVLETDEPSSEKFRKAEARAFLPLLLDPGSRTEPENGEVELYSPLVGEYVRIVVRGGAKIPHHPFLVAFGVWIVPRKRFLARSILRPLLPSPESVPRRIPGAETPPASTRTNELADELRGAALDILAKFEMSGDISVAGEERGRLDDIRSTLRKHSAGVMDGYFADRNLLLRVRKGGFLSPRLEDLRAPAAPADIFSAVDADSLPQFDYRRNNALTNLGPEFADTFDCVFAEMLASLGDYETAV